MDDIIVKDLRKSFHKNKKKVVAVDDISFSVRKGEIFGLLGVNGAGKTTTINMLTGLIEKDSGTIQIMGMDPNKDWEKVRNNINVSTAYYPLSDVLTVRQNLRIYAKIYQVKDRERKIDRLLDAFGLTRLQNRRVIELSSGETTRAALAKGLINEPKVLFLDECTVGLDPDIAEKTRQYIKDYQKRTGCTILFTSHYMYEVEELCDRIAFMDCGKVVTISTAEELKKTITKTQIELTVKQGRKELETFLKDRNINVIQAKRNTILFEVTYKKDQIFKVLNRIFEQEFLLKDLHIKKPTLNDIFISFARRNRCREDRK
jgi:ABC-2 type transport system ATP-binding protein